MGRLTEVPFRESCCDGGECSANELSSRACGCDPGAQWHCGVFPDCEYGKEVNMRSQRGEKFGPVTEGTIDEMIPNPSFTVGKDEKTGQMVVKRKVTPEQFNKMVENREYVGDVTIIDLPKPPPTAEVIEGVRKAMGLSADPARPNATGAPTRATTFPPDAAGRKTRPVASGVLDYFPDALVAVAEVSYQGNKQHHADKPLHWDRTKSKDESDAMIRHFLQRGSIDDDGIRHSAKMVWRALAILQKEIENESAR